MSIAESGDPALMAADLGKRTRAVDWSRATSLAGYDMGADGWVSLLERASAGDSSTWAMCARIRDAAYPYLTAQEQQAFSLGGIQEQTFDTSMWSLNNLAGGIQTELNSVAGAAGAAAGRALAPEAEDVAKRTRTIVMVVIAIAILVAVALYF